MHIIVTILSMLLTISISHAQLGPHSSNSEEAASSVDSATTEVTEADTPTDTPTDTPRAVIDFYQNPALPLGAVQAAPHVYSDVSRNHWAAQAIARMTQLGIITGYPDGTFQGQNSISRYESAVLTARLYSFLIDYADQLYLYNNQDIGTLQEIIRFQQAQLEQQEEKISLLNQQLQEQTVQQTQISQNLQQLQSQVGTTPTPGLSPGNNMLESLEQLHTANRVNIDHLRQLERQVQQLQQQITNSEPAQLASESSSQPAEDNAAAQEDNHAQSPPSGSSYDGTAIAITPSEGQRPENGLSLAAARAKPVYIGVTPLAVNTYGGFTLGLRVGYDHVQGPIGVVGKLNYAIGAGLLTASVNGIVPINTPLDNLDIYAGVGLGINTTLNAASAMTGFMLELPLGVEYFIHDDMSFFAEISPDYRFSIHTASVSLSTGINFHF